MQFSSLCTRGRQPAHNKTREVSILCDQNDTAGIEIRQAQRPGEQPPGGLTKDEKQAIKERNKELEQQGRRICHTCGIEQDLEQGFSKQDKGRSYFARCKQCANAARNERRRSRDGLAYALERGHRRAREAGLPAVKFTRADLLEYWDDLGINPWECFHTRVPLRREPGYPNSRTIDHVQPLSDPESAGHVVENIVPCSASFNTAKRDRPAHHMPMLKDPDKYPGVCYAGLNDGLAGVDGDGNPLAPARAEWSEGESPALVITLGEPVDA